MPLITSIPAQNSVTGRAATVQVACNPTTHEPRRLVVDDGYETASVRLDEATVRRIVGALTGAE